MKDSAKGLAAKLRKLESPSRDDKVQEFLNIVTNIDSSEEVELVTKFLADLKPHIINLNNLYLKLHQQPESEYTSQVIRVIDGRFERTIKERFKDLDEETKISELNRLISEGNENASNLPSIIVRQGEISEIKKVIQQSHLSSSDLYSLFEKLTLKEPNQYNIQLTKFLSPLILNAVDRDLKNLNRTEELEIQELQNEEEQYKKEAIRRIKEEKSNSAEEIKNKVEVLEAKRSEDFILKLNAHLARRRVDLLTKIISKGAKVYRWKKEYLPPQVEQEIQLIKSFIEEDLNSYNYGSTISKIDILHTIFGKIVAEKPSYYANTMAQFFIPKIVKITNQTLASLEEASLEEKVKGVSELLSKSSKAYPLTSSTLHPSISEERNPVMDFIIRHQEISAAETEASKQPSLLYSISAGAIAAYVLPVVNSLIESSPNLSDRPDLIEIMVKDHTISSDPDMSETFDLLVRKGIPHPSEALVKKMVEDTRIRSGNNASKLAMSFLYHRGDVAMIRQILQYERNNADKKILEESLTNAGFKHQDNTILLKNIGCLVALNNDELLYKLLNKKGPDKELLLNQFLNNWPDHSLPLNLAAERKLIKTYEMLINAGFNPLQHPEGATNSFALACKTQGKATLEPFLKSIREKFGTTVAKEVVREVDADNKSALDHVVAGDTAYLDVVRFLLENGAEIKHNNLMLAAERGHAAVFEHLLKKRIMSVDQHEQLFELIKDRGNYVISSIFIEHLKKFDKEGAKELIASLESKKERFTSRDLFEICATSGEKTLEYYVRARPEYNLRNEINNFDDNQRTPLYYAISGRAFGKLVTFLIANSADTNCVAEEHGKPISAPTLAIRNIQPKTLSAILASERFSQINTSGLSFDSILQAARELMNPQNNEAVLTDSFVSGLSVEEINKLPSEIRKTLFERSIQTENQETIDKIKIAIINGDADLKKHVEDFFAKAIEDSNVRLVESLINQFHVHDFLSESQTSSVASVEEISSGKEEKTSSTESLLPSSSTRSHSVVKLGDINKYMDTALLVSQNTTSSEARDIVDILRSHNFKSSAKETFVESVKNGREANNNNCIIM